MKKRINQLKIIFNDVLYVSKQTGTTNKKLTINLLKIKHLFIQLHLYY